MNKKEVMRWIVLAALALCFGWLAFQERVLVFRYGDLRSGVKIAAAGLAVGIGYFAVLFMPAILEKRRKN